MTKTKVKPPKEKGLNISAKSYITALAIIFALMVATYVLTFILPGGEYARTVDASGNTIIDAEGGFQYVEGGISFIKWILSPILVLTADGSSTIIAVIIFLLVIGGVFACVNKCGLMKYMLEKIVDKFLESRRKLLAIVTLFFMLMGALVGSFEECVPLVPIVVALSIGLGYDALTGLGISILAAGCGFASGVANPFTVGVAQKLAGLPMFSGLWFRALAFIPIYGLLIAFILLHAKKIEKPIDQIKADNNYIKNPTMDKALITFASIIGVGILCVLMSGFVTALQDYTMIIVALMYLIAGIVASFVAKYRGKTFFKSFGGGIVEILPAVLMILMASSIKYTMTEAKILDTILHGILALTDSMPKFAVLLIIYLLVLVMNFFIASGSAKAFLLIPLIIPIANLCGISSQLCIVAFAFGDGFSNVFYPTNPVLLISLGTSNVSYKEWFKWTWKYQLLNLLLTSGILLIGLAIGYA